MHVANLRKVGGSVMLALPPAVLDMLRLRAGATVDVAIDGDHLVIKPQRKRRYTLDELLAKCDRKARITKASREWLDVKPVGREL